MNYIGIRGHRGAGKSSIAWLLGNTINFIKGGNEGLLGSELFEHMYDRWCDQIMMNPNIINESSIQSVYLDSFSDSIKTFVQLLLGCPEEYLREDSYKDSIVVNLRDFSCTPIEQLGEVNLTSASDLYDSVDKDADPQPIMKNIYMSLREFILYFGLDVMQRFFGRNVWVKSLRVNTEMLDKFYDGKGMYRIYMDLKTPAEATYIKQQNGLIVNVVRPGHKKGQSGLERLGRDDRIDFAIEITGDLKETKTDIINIAKAIINRFENGGREESKEE
jgi:hypothetical protein